MSTTTKNNIKTMSKTNLKTMSTDNLKKQFKKKKSNNKYSQSPQGM